MHISWFLIRRQSRNAYQLVSDKKTEQERILIGF